MPRYWYKCCPRCKQGQLFIELNRTTNSLILLCDECYWAFSDPHLCDRVDDGEFGFDLHVSEPTLEEISVRGWLVLRQFRILGLA
jgi:hypothetical protein